MSAAPTPLHVPWQRGVVVLQERSPNDLFVFGANAAGFHGAGAAAVAWRGVNDGRWRTDPAFLAAQQWHRRGVRGDDDRLRGVRALFGTASGLMRGLQGHSYGVVTIQKPGLIRSVPLREIYAQLLTLHEFSASWPGQVLITPLGEVMAGYSPAELDLVWRTLLQRRGLPPTWEFWRP